VLLWSLADL